MDDAVVVSPHQIKFGLHWIKILNSGSWTVMYNRLWRVEEQSKHELETSPGTCSAGSPSGTTAEPWVVAIVRCKFLEHVAL